MSVASEWAKKWRDAEHERPTLKLEGDTTASTAYVQGDGQIYLSGGYYTEEKALKIAHWILNVVSKKAVVVLVALGLAACATTTPCEATVTNDKGEKVCVRGGGDIWRPTK